MAELLLPLILVLLIGVALAFSIKKISDYYYSHYKFSIWAGVFIILIAGLFLFISVSATTKAGYAFFQIGGLFMIAFVCIQNVRLSTTLMGILAFVLQIFLAISFFALFLVYFSRRIINLILGKRTIFSHIEPGVAFGFHAGEPMRYYFSLHLKQ